MSDDILYVMGVYPGTTTGVAIIGVHQLTIYADRPGKIKFFETWEITGSYTYQAIEVADASREFYPLALVVESFYPAKPITTEESLSPVHVGARIEFCADSHYIFAPFFWQTPSMAMETAPDSRLKLWGLYQSGPDHIKNATRHAITFIRRTKDDEKLRTRAWGPEDLRLGRRRGSIARPVRRLYLTDGPATKGGVPYECVFPDFSE